MDDEGISRDTLFGGRVVLYQRLRGFRSSLDPVLLTGWVAPPFGRFLDIGSGTGAVSFLLMARDPAAVGVGLEIDRDLTALSLRGAGEGAYLDRYQVRNEDARRAVVEPGGFDLVISNPPYRPLGSGPLPDSVQKARAHHEVALTLRQWATLAAHALRPGGRLCVILPHERSAEVQRVTSECGLVPARVRAVRPRPGDPPSRVLFEAHKGVAANSLLTEPDLIVHEGPDYTAEVRRSLGEGIYPIP